MISILCYGSLCCFMFVVVSNCLITAMQCWRTVYCDSVLMSQPGLGATNPWSAFELTPKECCVKQVCALLKQGVGPAWSPSQIVLFPSGSLRKQALYPFSCYRLTDCSSSLRHEPYLEYTPVLDSQAAVSSRVPQTLAMQLPHEWLLVGSKESLHADVFDLDVPPEFPLGSATHVTIFTRSSLVEQTTPAAINISTLPEIALPWLWETVDAQDPHVSSQLGFCLFTGFGNPL